jgi:hypothetical protein
VAALPPSGRVVTESVAALIIDHWYQSNQTAAHKSIIAGMFATSVSVVERIIKAYEESHTVRVPRQGQGRSSDARNFFGVAGASGPANLLRLEAAYGAGKVDDFVADIRSRFLADGFGLNANGAAQDESTLARVLRTTLDYTGKQVSKRARERDEKACDKWISRMTGDYTSDMLVFIDETYAPHCQLRASCKAQLPPTKPRSTPTGWSLLTWSCWEWTGMRTCGLPTVSMAGPRGVSGLVARASSTVARHIPPSAYAYRAPTASHMGQLLLPPLPASMGAGLLPCLLACLPACLLACLPACLLACLPACLLAYLPALWFLVV